MLRWHGTTNNCRLNIDKMIPMAERYAEITNSNGHQCDTMNLLKQSEQAQDQSSALARTASTFSLASPGPRSCFSGGGVSPSPAKICSEENK